MTTRAFIGIGSNLDDPAAQVRRAVTALDTLAGCRCVAVSRRYRNPPMGPADQPDYVNAVAALDTTRAAHDLLAGLQALEAAAGRERNGRRWGPRPLDLDLLLYDDAQIDTEDLTVPHPGVTVRAFVIVPLAEIDPDRRVPGAGRAGDLAAAVDDSGLRVEED
ncbi:2-amino-4-hydroxy-6-hydroxymethyldihydropteridine diphosphokinase [Spiribacter vilamensis]|uniref:2-amino-4-hydroxy-6-hydroxymethyldihydropteridine pyrophosphokinase n=1 Tax=Spiribacter vilamensis TaxID=531306 RepID=A0A4Q8D149_9GAMM|nr:2-amino-4-hydroxy-6-hydroxymethyldihydropteridine diphosphokinase [Spiribacter vilamensis]RZU98967.1 2-amino-4-hydroxy-6-hydroxymethyldihydropteridine diphosphokinase [Spiribacter vilamensis]TVO62024.1 2-amino-4-hydroxy-6-hydroxymethyldihydropteridine diphosphokinase [Spiribacter vilamensis]